MKNENNRIIINEAALDKTKFGYARVSTAEQNEARQLEAFKKLELYKIFVEKASAKDINRPMLTQLLEYVREADTIYIYDFSRLARNTADLLQITSDLKKRKIKLISITENLDTSNPTGELMLTLIGAIATFERQVLLERQREGIALAVKDGKYKGRKKVDKPKEWADVYELYITRQITGTEAMKKLGLKRTTFYKFVESEKP